MTLLRGCGRTELAASSRVLGGQPDFSPDSLAQRSYVAYDDSSDLQAMIRANLIAERKVVESYGQIIKLIGDRDSATRRLVEDILSDEVDHAEELKGWLVAEVPCDRPPEGHFGATTEPT